MSSTLALVAAMLFGAVAGAQAAGSDDEVSRRLFEELLAPVGDLAGSTAAAGIAIRGLPGASGPARRFHEAVGDAFLDRGYDVWLLKADEAVPAGVLALDLELRASEIDYPRQTRQFLGIGNPQIMRRVSLGAHLRLSDPQAGRVLYDAEPVHVVQEWMSFPEANRNAALRPDWMGAVPVAAAEPRNPWWQRAFVVGIVGGVAVVYFSGAT